jgi:hypothetical protein
MDPERQKLGRLLRNGTATLSFLFLSAAVGLPKLAEKTTPYDKVPVETQIFLGFFGTVMAGMAITTHLGIRKDRNDPPGPK